MPRKHVSAGEAAVKHLTPKQKGDFTRRAASILTPERAEEVREGIDMALALADTTDVGLAILFLAGELGIDPGPHTLAELVAMVIGKRRAEANARQLTATDVLPAPQARIIIRDQRLYLDGQHVPLDMTPEATTQALTFVGALTTEWASSSDLAKRDPKLEGVRLDRVLRSMPTAVQDAIESSKRKGYRLAQIVH